jgi:ATP-binding cassette subfamily B protein
MFHKVQTYDFGNIDKFSSSSIVTRLTSDVATLQMTFQMSIRMIFRTPVMLVMALVMAFRISPQMSIIYCVILPLLAFGIFSLIGVVHPIFERVFKSYDKLNNVVQENIHGIRVVKSFVRKEKEVEKFQDTSDTIYKDFVKAERILAFNGPMMQLAVYSCIILISYFGARMVVGSRLDVAALTALFTYTGQILGGLMMMSMVFVMYTMSRAPMRRAYELLTEEPALKNPENPVFDVKDGSIDFQNVSFRYAETAGRIRWRSGHRQRRQRRNGIFCTRGRGLFAGSSCRG